MKIGTPGFVKERLTQARQARGLNGTELADLIGVTPQSVSQYERGKQTPSPEMLSMISDKLNIPASYFMRETETTERNPIFWRGRSTATRAARDRAEIRLIWLREIIDYLTDFFDFPVLDLPELELPRDFREIDTELLEAAASFVRSHWRVGDSAMPDLLLEMENNGIILSRVFVGAEKLDAFSQWSDKYKIPFVMLGRDKSSACRQRFDAAHELAHVVLHRAVDPKRLNSAADYKILEDQAHYFASALLMPAESFSNDLYAPTLDAMLSIKERWRVSVAAMIKRCEALDIISDDGARRLWINYNRRGWRIVEPFDGKIEKERPRLLRRSMTMLLSEQEQSVAQVLAAVPLTPKDIEELCDLDVGTLTGDRADARAMPILKRKPQPEPQRSNVVQMFRRRE
jgi:Zn-dependent peptidase ImmA (M78 family)/transcriptional regulator with XRE-family HTH domain